jgi:cell wall-associated NlpC family hydrolase
VPYILLGVFAALLIAVPAFATPSPSVSTKRAEAQRVLGEIDRLGGELSEANERLNLANLKLARVQGEIKENRHELRVAKHNLQRSQATIAQRLVTLYTKGETSPLEVILGARSLVEVLNRMDTENRVATLDAEVISQVRTFRTAVTRHARELRRDQAQARRPVAARAERQRSFEAQLAERQQLLSSLSGEIERLIEAQQARELAASRTPPRRALTAQSRGLATAAEPVIGVSAATPEGATVIPPSQYGGAVGVALSYIGTPYVWGGAAPGGFDCSGLVIYAYGQLGVSLPHSSYALWNVGVPVSYGQLEAGDLVFFQGLGHMGMYIGGGQMVHAPQTGDVVKVSSIGPGTHYASRFVGARRVL